LLFQQVSTIHFPALRWNGFPTRVAALAMSSLASSAPRGDGRLWVIAGGLSLFLNLGILVSVALVSIKSEEIRKLAAAAAPTPPASAETLITIFPEMVDATSTPAEPASPAKPKFARTSPDQTAPAPESAAFMGERNTQATSDRTPDPSAPALPSQTGIEKEHQDLETTQSDYQDGSLDTNPSARTPESLPAQAAQSPTPMEENVATEPSPASPAAPARETLLQGTSPVDVPVARDASGENEIKPTPPKPPDPANRPTASEETPKPAAARSDDPAFSGYQRKAAIVGSISRTGRSALDVADSPLGRYQAAISRAVEQEWQRNCVRHRDFITPGFLTVRFFVETSGRVRSVRFVGNMETGEIQKGFTLNAIRDADIPAMPPSLKKEFEKEPLELIFNFLF
jgi:hypothetical protein